VRWRRLDLKRVIAERFGVDFHPRYVGKLLKKLGFSHISARPRHPMQDERIVEGFKNVWPAPSARDFSRAPMISLVQRIRLRRTPSQPRWRYAHSGPHKLPGVERRFLNQAFGAPFDCQAISISPLANLIDRSARFSALRLCPDQRLRRQGQSPDDEPFAAP
jgi:Winged helix-turn helix